MLEFVELLEGNKVEDRRGFDPGSADLREQVEHLERALRSRTTIGQATGLIMSSCKLDHASAFQVLVRISSDQNRKLSAIATQLVEQHDRDPGGNPLRALGPSQAEYESRSRR